MSGTTKPSPNQLNRNSLQNQLVEELKVQWKLLWAERFYDETKAESVSIHDYASLFVERGTVIHASKDFKQLNFKEILENHLVENPERYVPPPTECGGWNKFVKTNITGQKNKEMKIKPNKLVESRIDKQIKSRRGWLHIL